MRAIQCLIISIFAILSASGTAPWGGYLGKYLLQRPFIGGLICGIVFGDITQGILIGAAMQLVYIGYFNVGGVQSIDMGIISFPCVAIAMMSGIDTSAAIALATGLGALFTTLEMISPTLFFSTIVCTINSFQVFEPINLMTLGGPANSTNTLVYQIYSDAFKYLKLGQASAEGVVLLVFVLVLTVIYFAFLGKKVHYQ